jgi:hypothetical protein
MSSSQLKLRKLLSYVRRTKINYRLKGQCLEIFFYSGFFHESQSRDTVPLNGGGVS